MKVPGLRSSNLNSTLEIEATAVKLWITIAMSTCTAAVRRKEPAEEHRWRHAEGDGV